MNILVFNWTEDDKKNTNTVKALFRYDASSCFSLSVWYQTLAENVTHVSYWMFNASLEIFKVAEVIEGALSKI